MKIREQIEAVTGGMTPEQVLTESEKFEKHLAAVASVNEGEEIDRRAWVDRDPHENIGDVSAARPPASNAPPHEWVAYVQHHFNEFRKIQHKHSDFGAGDTEPDWHYQDVLRRAVQGKAHEAPTSAGGWELFSDMPGAGAAAREMRSSAIKTHRAIRRGIGHRNPEVSRAVGKHVRDYAWRVNI